MQILSIRLSADGFSFSILNPIEETFTYAPLRIQPNISLAANIKQVLATNELLQNKFKRTNVLIDSGTEYTTVPFELFEDEQNDTIYHYNHPFRTGETILHNILDRSNMAILFATEKNACQLIKELFPEAHIFASISPIIEHMANKSRMGCNRKMYLHLNKRTTDILAFEHGKPLYVNTLNCQNGSDCSFYTLSIWQQLEFDQEHDQLHIIGDQHYKEELMQELKNFIKQVNTINPSVEFNRSVAARNEQVPYDMLTLLHTNL